MDRVKETVSYTESLLKRIDELTEQLDKTTQHDKKVTEQLDKLRGALFYWKAICKKYAIEKAELQERLNEVNRELFELRSKS